ncbi:MAG: hypothetical protein Q7K34_02745, partial [archaeon]|nr:hypothetical protein [archaeon]
MKPLRKSIFQKARAGLALNVLKKARKNSSSSMSSSRSAAGFSRIYHTTAKSYLELAEDFKKRGSDPSLLESVVLEQAQKSINSANEASAHLKNALAIRNAARKRAEWIAGKNRK